MFEYFYNENLRRTIISFGTLFNDISIKHTDSDDNTVSVVKIPLAYGPTQKFLARIEQSPDLNKPFAITLPRMSFEFTGLTYDASRKVTTTSTFVVKDPNDGKETKKSYMPVPYNMQFELAIMCKLNDDALQIVEQILPYFQPAYNVSVELVQGLQEKRDIPVVLENITMQDDYEGDFSSRRVLLYTLRFTAKTYLFGPASKATKDIIKKATVSYLTGTDTSNSTREVTYSVEPRAIKNYTGNAATNVGIATSVFEFGRANCGVVTGIAVTFGGGGYLSPPNVTISNEVSEKNYINVPGISTATGISTISPGGTVSSINILDSGYGYVITPEVTLSNPESEGTGTFTFNEIVTGSSSGTTARVRTWDASSNVLIVGTVSGEFISGETLVGSTSGASYELRIVDVQPADDGFADNINIETEADSIIDFSEQNPFGMP